MGIDYKQAGVDVEAGDALVDWLKQTEPQWPHRDRLVEGIGGFAALFRANFPKLKKPCLVSCTDGVGTKLKLAVHFQSYSEVAQDLVAMCVNDLVCSGAQPLFFLDYYASGKLELNNAKQFLDGIRCACLESELALIGGETAEMPGVYDGHDFDCAGFAIGVVDEDEALGKHRVKHGDAVIGISSSGFHSNGFSLLRKVFATDLESWKAELLKPTALYPKLVKHALSLGGLRSIAHITGGGMDNLPRVLPKFTEVKLRSWPVPAPFLEVKKRTGLKWSEMLRTLNCGIGMIWISEPEKVKVLKEAVVKSGFQAFELGFVEKSQTEEAGWSLSDPAWEGFDQ